MYCIIVLLAAPHQLLRYHLWDSDDRDGGGEVQKARGLRETRSCRREGGGLAK